MPRGHQGGVATLLIVMVLFFIVSLVAAYTSRNLIFEQRTSANQYRSTQAVEVAEAGVEWTLAMLNAGRVDDECKPTTDPTFNTFRDRYLSETGADNTAVGSDGAISIRTRTDPDPLDGVAAPPLMPLCVFDAESEPMAWACHCPSDAAPSLPTVAGTAAQPMFRILFLPTEGRPDVVRIVAAGCTRPDQSCVAEEPSAPPGDAMAVVTLHIALKSALTTPPGAAVTALDNIDMGAGLLSATNTDHLTQGVTLLAGGTITGPLSGLTSTPGTPGEESALQLDTALMNGLDAFAGLSRQDRMFASVFGMLPDVYRQQPAAVNVDCTAGCTSNAINTLVANNPGRLLWLTGDLTVDGDIGTAARPAMLVVDGQVNFSGTSADEVWGLVYTRSDPPDPTWEWDRGSGSTVVRGAIIAEGNLSGSGNQSIIYDTAVLNRLHTGHGSFVRVPGGWRDF